MVMMSNARLNDGRRAPAARVGRVYLALALLGPLAAARCGDASIGADDKGSAPSRAAGPHNASGSTGVSRPGESVGSPTAPASQPSGSGGSAGFASTADAAGSGGGAAATGSPGAPGSLGSPGSPGYQAAPGGNTNVALGGSQDFGYFRRQLNDNRVPREGDFDAAGFFAEHHTRLPQPVCGERVCLQSMLAVMGSLSTGSSCTMLQIGLNSPLVADPSKRPPLTLAVVIDVSGSMNERGKMDFVKLGLEKMIDGMRDGDKVALITYSDRVNVPFPMQDVNLKRTELRDVVRGLVATGGTNIHDGLRRGYEEVQKHFDGNRQNRVLFLSDGQPTVGITGTEAILAMSKRWNSEGLGLTSIGLGTDFAPALMRGLAQQADGNFYFVENAGAVSEVFTEEINYFTVPVAFDLKVELESGSHYNFGRAYGSPFWKDSPIGGRLEVPSVFLAHRKSDKDVTNDGGRRGGGSALIIELMPKRVSDDGSGVTSADVGTITFQFREPGTGRIVRDKITVNYPDAPWRTRERGFFQSQDVSIIQKSFVMLNVYVGMEEAIRSFWRGSRSEILGNLKRLAAAVDDYNEEVKDLDIAADRQLLEQLMQVLRRNGVVDPAEVRIPANPWPAD
jgi:Ca-activated chloride channel family protein